MSDIFISYASEDKEKAGLLSKVLEEQGWSVWWDRKIPPGRTFDEVIEEALDAAKCVVVLWSKASVKSGWVKEEASEGNRRKILVPGVIEDVNIPLGFRRIQAAHLIDWNGEKSHQEVNQLIDSVEKILGIPRKFQSKTERVDLKKDEVLKQEEKVIDKKSGLQKHTGEKIETKPVTIEKTEAEPIVQLPHKSKAEEEERRKPEKQRNNATSGTVKKSKLVWLIPSIIVPIISVIVVFSLYNHKTTQGIVSTNVEPKIPGVNKNMVFVKGGCFQMGDTFGDGQKNERPVHKVCVDGFSIGKYEVTQGQWMAVMGTNPSKFQQGDNYPVENVSWEDVQKFIRNLNKKTGKRYRLPTEAEWEYAARSGGGKEKYAGFSDDEELYLYANFCDSNCGKSWNDDKQNDGYENTSPVGSFRPNGIGLYDMSGNVWEWCRDWYGSEYYKNSPVNGPKGPGEGSFRVFRGGSWDFSAGRCRSSFRSAYDPSYGYYNLGFRLVLPQAIR